MKIALVVLGLVLVLVGVQNTYNDFGKTLKGDFTGPGNFLYRAAAIGLIGLIGVAGEGGRKLSLGLLILMTLGLLVSKDKGFFANLAKGVSASPVKPVSNPTGGTSPTSTSSQLGSALKLGTSLLKSAGALLAI